MTTECGIVEKNTSGGGEGGGRKRKGRDLQSLPKFAFGAPPPFYFSHGGWSVWERVVAMVIAGRLFLSSSFFFFFTFY